jgi:hypothetical protein
MDVQKQQKLNPKPPVFGPKLRFGRNYRRYPLTGLAKMDAVAEHIIDTHFYDPSNFDDKKILVFAHHKCVLNTICAALAKQVHTRDGSDRAQKNRNSYDLKKIRNRNSDDLKKIGIPMKNTPKIGISEVGAIPGAYIYSSSII